MEVVLYILSLLIQEVYNCYHRENSKGQEQIKHRVLIVQKHHSHHEGSADAGDGHVQKVINEVLIVFQFVLVEFLLTVVEDLLEGAILVNGVEQAL